MSAHRHFSITPPYVFCDRKIKKKSSIVIFISSIDGSILSMCPYTVRCWVKYYVRLFLSYPCYFSGYIIMRSYACLGPNIFQVYFHLLYNNNKTKSANDYKHNVLGTGS